MRFHVILQFQGELSQLVEKYQSLGLRADELSQPATETIENIALGRPGVPPLAAEEAEELAQAYERVNGGN